MKKKNYLTLDEEFLLYCQLNKIEDVDKLAKQVFEKGFSILKYGETPSFAKGKERVVEKEVIKEIPIEIIKEVEKIVIKEKPIEKIVEVIKEVPVVIEGETKIITKEIIKEIPIEKIIEVENTEVVDKLKLENSKLKEELENINKSLDKFNKAKYMKNSNLGSLYDE